MTRAPRLPAFARSARNIFGLVVLLGACAKDGTTPPAVAKVKSVAVTPATATLTVGGTVQLAAAVLDSTGAALSGRAVSWSSGSPAVATVNTTGLVTAVAGGTATVSATSEGTTGSATVTVASVFSPTTNGTLTGTQRYTSVNIPAGVVITATGDLALSASGPIVLAGTLTGNCTRISLTGEAATTVTGKVDNSCSDASADGMDLTIVGKRGIAVSNAAITSSGNIFLTNDPTLTDADFPAPALLFGGASAPLAEPRGGRNSVSQAAGADCSFSGVYSITPKAARAGAPSEKLFLSGAAGKSVQASCRGNGELGGFPGTVMTGQDGGAGGTGTSMSNSFAEARAGDGKDGGDVKIRTTGNLSFVGLGFVFLVSGRGGDGGVATATGLPNSTLTRGTNAFATGGWGGSPGLVDIRAGGAIAITATLSLVVGRAGHGGSATATASDGNDAGASAAQAGGDAQATGGQGGSTPKLTLTARGAVTGVATVSGGNAGNGGAAKPKSGNGGKGNEAFPTGGAGGSVALNTNIASNGNTANVGNGGNAGLRDLGGMLIGVGGNGSAGTISLGTGGQGWNDCGIPRKAGGAGGMGGSAAGRDGSGGTGSAMGVFGGISFNAFGNGGNGGNGVGPGAGGAAGADATTPPAARKSGLATSFKPGVDGAACQPINLASTITVASDPNGHEQYVGYRNVTMLTEAITGNTITITGPAPWVMVSGPYDAMGNFVATGSGTVAGYPNVPAKLVGTVTSSGTISGTIQLGQTAAPTGLPNGPVNYNLATTRP